MSQSSSSFGYLEHDPFDDFLNSSRTEPKKGGSPQIPTNQKNVQEAKGQNFQDLMDITKNKQTKKKESPYLKKNQIEVV